MSWRTTFNLPGGLPKSYINTEEYRNALQIMDKREMVKVLKQLAESGNIHAANFYGDLLILGVWDEEKMAIDMARGQLIPPPLDSSKDPYLILPRDPDRASYFYVIAWCDPAFKTNLTYIRASDKTLFCIKYGLAGFQENENNAKPFIRFKDKEMLKKCAVNMLKDNSNEFLFVPLPDERPNVLNPQTAVFERIAEAQKNKCKYEIYFATAALILPHCIPDFSLFSLKIIASFFALTVLPYIASYYALESFGVKGKLPTCSCCKIREAHSNQMQKLPPDCRCISDPFETTNFFIRNFLNIKRIYLWIGIVLTIALFVLCIHRRPFNSWRIILHLIFSFLVSCQSLMWDKISSDTFSDLFFMFPASLVFFCFPDGYCAHELEVVNRKYHYENALKDLDDEIKRSL